jgi:putative two-component system response regulator
MAVADVYDALVEDRIYRSSMGHAQASGIIFENSGSHFDPRVVEAFKNTQDEISEIARTYHEKSTIIIEG